MTHETVRNEDQTERHDDRLVSDRLATLSSLLGAAEAKLEAAGKIDLDAGEYIADIEEHDDTFIAVIARHGEILRRVDVTDEAAPGPSFGAYPEDDFGFEDGVILVIADPQMLEVILHGLMGCNRCHSEIICAAEPVSDAIAIDAMIDALFLGASPEDVSSSRSPKSQSKPKRFGKEIRTREVLDATKQQGFRPANNGRSTSRGNTSRARSTKRG